MKYDGSVDCGRLCQSLSQLSVLLLHILTCIDYLTPILEQVLLSASHLSLFPACNSLTVIDGQQWPMR